MFPGAANCCGLARFVPSSDDPWNREKATHLARRASFGGTPQEIQRLVDLGLEGAVASLVEFEDEDPALDELVHETGGALYDIEDPERAGQPLIDNVRMWWIFRMVHTRAPLQEKLALLWHDHFATQESEDLRATLVLEQNRLFRRHAAGSFRDLLHGVARDPAMLMFLDNRANHREHPNENWARELLELFTLGFDRYTQRDVVEIARAFTGWTTPDPASTDFTFVPKRHDPTDKAVFGEILRGREGPEGIAEGDEVLERVLARDECAPFVARKIARWFHDDDPEPELVDDLAAVLRPRWSIRETVRALLLSKAFWDPTRKHSFTRSPVDFVATVARTLGVQNVHVLRPERASRAMGMHVFRPPSVAGWELGRAWIHAGASLARRDFAELVADAAHAPHRVQGTAALDVDALAADAADDPAEIVRNVVRRLLVRDLSSERERALIEDVALEQGGKRARIRRAVKWIVGSSEMVPA